MEASFENLAVDTLIRKEVAESLNAIKYLIY